jgi:hypothetical protein
MKSSGLTQRARLGTLQFYGGGLLVARRNVLGLRSANATLVHVGDALILLTPTMCRDTRRDERL